MLPLVGGDPGCGEGGKALLDARFNDAMVGSTQRDEVTDIGVSTL